MSGATSAIALAAAVAGAAVSAVGAIQQGQAQSQQAKYNAAVAHNNQIIAQQNAQDALDRGAAEEQQQRKKTQMLIGQQRSSLAAQGADLSSGSALDLVGDIAGTGELDALTIRHNAALEARQYQVQGVNFQAEGQLQKMQGRAAKTASYFDATSSLLSSASSVAGKFG
ncbi:MAG TPA: hypothetical protein VF920_17325 [Dongiaceae bacterium]